MWKANTFQTKWDTYDLAHHPKNKDVDSGKDVNVICETIVHGAHKVDTIYHQMKHMNCSIVFYHGATKIEDR